MLIRIKGMILGCKGWFIRMVYSKFHGKGDIVDEALLDCTQMCEQFLLIDDASVVTYLFSVQWQMALYL